MWKKILLGIIAVFLILIIGVILITAIRNRNLPTQSTVVDRLSTLDKARLAEAFHLRETLGERVWPDWGQADIPVIVYNESYAFLVGYQGQPPEGWIKVPQQVKRGGPWEIVPDDLFLGEQYYRQELPGSNITPENFTVLVGDQWVATLQTREYAAIAFYDGFRNDLPTFIQPVFPYRLVWQLLMGQTDSYIEGLAHETFHAFQGINAPQRLAESERAAPTADRYPWDDAALEEAWEMELELLYSAVTASSDVESTELTRQFLTQRQIRRSLPGMNASLADFEQKREWLEGLAKYAELTIGLTAARSADYQPIADIEADREFKAYRTQERYYSQQLREAKQGRTGDIRFYYSGMAQAALLDRLMPDWKNQALEADVWLDTLLTEAVRQ